MCGAAGARATALHGKKIASRRSCCGLRFLARPLKGCCVRGVRVLPVHGLGLNRKRKERKGKKEMTGGVEVALGMGLVPESALLTESEIRLTSGFHNLTSKERR
jgi:hypothetical protein